MNKKPIIIRNIMATKLPIVSGVSITDQIENVKLDRERFSDFEKPAKYVAVVNMTRFNSDALSVNLPKTI
jgi:hypothetical protein